MTARTDQMALRLWREFLSRHKGRLALGVLAMIGLASAEAGLLAATQWVFAGLDPARGDAPGADPATVMVWGPVILIGLGVLQAGFFYAQAVLAQGAAILTLKDMQHRMFARIGGFDLAQLAGEGAGQLVSRFTNDLTVLRESLTRAPNGLRDAIRLAVIVGYLAWLDWVLFAAVLIVYPLAGLPVGWLGGRIRWLARRVQTQIGGLTGLLTESLRGQAMVKTYGLEEQERRRLGRAFDERAGLLLRLVRLRAANEPIITVIGAIAIGAIIGVAAFRIGAGSLTGPELVTFLVGMAVLSQPARGLGTLHAVVQEGMGSLERVFGVLDRRGTITDRPGAAPLRLERGKPPAIRFEDVTFSYGEPAVLDGLTLDVPAGATVALVGPSGAGKSTVFGLLPRLYEAGSGRILIEGQEVRSLTLKSLRDAIALVAQDAVLFDDTIAENIRYGCPGADDAAVVAAAKAAAAHGFIEALPDGYETRVGDAGSNLSGGQRQRIALARAFLKDAPILLLDEATAALDARSERLIEEALERLSDGRTTLVIAHRLSTVRHADLIVVMDQGRVVERGTHDGLMAEGGLYARLAAMQLREELPA
ncbi:ABC transporter ATP-binding protein [Parvularcula oceani]|uniref:ABC transporter ATP-binding protein n=1 Tax=Parvularcula oceani TaxID=1247963 RepID=UPI0004E10F8C|nr:ABC transporter ATP-binding protein [Parvularcula oceani]